MSRWLHTYTHVMQNGAGAARLPLPLPFKYRLVGCCSYFFIFPQLLKKKAPKCIVRGNGGRNVVRAVLGAPNGVGGGHGEEQGGFTFLGGLLVSSYWSTKVTFTFLLLDTSLFLCDEWAETTASKAPPGTQPSPGRRRLHQGPSPARGDEGSVLSRVGSVLGRDRLPTAPQGSSAPQRQPLLSVGDG